MSQNRFALMVSLVVFASCLGHITNTTGFVSLVNAKNPTSSAFTRTREPFIRFVGIETTDYGPCATFRFVNPTQETIYFNGYGPEAPQKWIQLHLAGSWRDVSWDWCGTGMELQTLSPGGATEIAIYLEEEADELWYDQLENPGPVQVVAEKASILLGGIGLDGAADAVFSLFQPELMTLAEHDCPIRVGTIYGADAKDINTEVWSDAVMMTREVAFAESGLPSANNE